MKSLKNIIPLIVIGIMTASIGLLLWQNYQLKKLCESKPFQHSTTSDTLNISDDYKSQRLTITPSGTASFGSTITSGTIKPTRVQKYPPKLSNNQQPNFLFTPADSTWTGKIGDFTIKGTGGIVDAGTDARFRNEPYIYFMPSTPSYIYVSDSANNPWQKYHIDFLKKHPKNPKLIYGKFSTNLIRLDLLMPDGNIYKNEFDVDLKDYSYETDNGQTLSFSSARSLDEQVAKLKPPKIFTKESFLYLTYDPFHKNIQTRIDYSISYRRLGLIVSGDFQSITPQLNLRAGLRYKLR